MNRTQPPTRAGRSLAFGIAAALAVVLAACGPAVTPAPSGSPLPSAPGPSGSAAPGPTTITSPVAAAALVLATDARFADLGPQDPNRIGECCFYAAAPTAEGYEVTIEIGWGDCPAGCINRHHWFYTVATDGTVRLDREDGPPVPDAVPGPGDGAGGVVGIRGVATAGPTCPVVRPNDPACADRPVAGVAIHVLDATGLEVATLQTDAAGGFTVALPPGRYRVQADAVEGLMGTAAPVDVTVTASLALVQLAFDTGIR
jgi:hypothetical protein